MKSFLSILTVLAMVIFLCVPVSALTYYVATTGSDSNTTTQAQVSSTPWLTIYHAIATAASNSTIIVSPGTYHETSTERPGTLYLKGTGWTVQSSTGVPGDVTISGTDSLANSATGEMTSTSITASNIAFKNVTILQRAADTGAIIAITAQGLNGLTLTNCSIILDASGSNKCFFTAFPGGGLTLSPNVDCENCSFNTTNGTNDEYLVGGFPSTSSDALISGFKVNSCTMNLTGGWSAGSFKGWTNIIVTNNSLIALDKYGLCIGYDNTPDGYATTNVLVANNFIQSTNGHALIIGAGVNGSTGTGVIVANNRIWETGNQSLSQDAVLKETTAVTFVDNDIWGVVPSTNGGLYMKGCKNCTISRNNVVMTSGQALKVYAGDSGNQCSGNTVTYNRFVAYGASANAVLWQLNNSVKPDDGTSVFDYNVYDQRAGATSTLINGSATTTGITTIAGFIAAGYGSSDAHSILAGAATLMAYKSNATSQKLYAQILNSGKQLWNGSAFESYDPNDFYLYNRYLGEDIPGSAHYTRRFPPSAPAGTYSVSILSQSGAVPSATDSQVAEQTFNFDGTNAIGLQTVNTKLGTPSGASVSADIAGVQTTSTANGTAIAGVPTAVWGAGGRTITGGTVTTVTGSVGSISGITFPGNFGTFSIDGSGKVTLTAGEHTAIQSDILGTPASGWNTSGTIGAKINTSGSASDPWATAFPGSYGAGTFGAALQEIDWLGYNCITYNPATHVLQHVKPGGGNIGAPETVTIDSSKNITVRQ